MVPKHHSLFRQEIGLREICILVRLTWGEVRIWLTKNLLCRMLSFNDPYLCAICACCSDDLSCPRISRAASDKSKSSLNRGSSKSTLFELCHQSQPSNITRRTGSRETNTHVSTPLRPSCRSATALFVVVTPLDASNGLQSRTHGALAVILLRWLLNLAPHFINNAHAGAARRFQCATTRHT